MLRNKLFSSDDAVLQPSQGTRRTWLLGSTKVHVDRSESGLLLSIERSGGRRKADAERAQVAIRPSERIAMIAVPRE